MICDDDELMNMGTSLGIVKLLSGMMLTHCDMLLLFLHPLSFNHNTACIYIVPLRGKES